MKIGIDLDDVVFEFARELLREYNSHHGTNYVFEDIFSYYFSEIFNKSSKEVELFMDNLFDKERVTTLPLCYLAKESIFSLAEKHEIYFITSRRTNQEGTIESLKLHFPEIPFNLIFSSNPYIWSIGKTKGDLCLEHGIDIMIEDSKEHGEDCAKKGIKTQRPIKRPNIRWAYSI
jgi:5'(3')-deoxyribonucleotidase